MTAQLIGNSAGMSRLRDYIPKLGRSDAHVLITGETGTGKECLAESIHEASPRRKQPFICVNCAAIPDSLLESELFGYERGAFSGAQHSYPGRLRLASGGTVFLDEIGEMSTVAQAKILRVLESNQVFPLGGRRVAEVDVRFIAATNQDLEPLVEQTRFRRDLYYRLNVVRVRMPPLRQRREDIPELMAHFIGKMNERGGHQVEGPTAEVQSLLRQYEWPGNVRELRNLVENIFVDPPEGPVEWKHLPDSFRSYFTGQERESTPERDQLLGVLQRTNWNKSKAAEQMKWSRMTLYRKMSKFHIVRED